MTRPTKIALIGLGAVIVVAAALSLRGPKISLPGPVQKAVREVTGKLPVLSDRMPAFSGITKWWNTPGGAAYTPETLKGKVVLVDFWTYSCINCLRTLPFLKSLHAKYAASGLVIIGVHTPEFAFEAVPGNVEAAIKSNGIEYPVALDPKYATWNAYENRYWPAEYLFDAQGRLRETHFGEGSYDETERAVRDLLAENSAADLPPAGVEDAVPDFSKIRTGETYFGLERGSAFMGEPGASGRDVQLKAADAPKPDKWTAGGLWSFAPEFAEARAAGDTFAMSVSASEMHIVLSSSDGTDKTIEVFVDGQDAGTVTVNASQLYTVAKFSGAGRHTVELRIRDAGVRFYATTFS
jgi:thiol-disulfide isomerase/thioredoxin